MFGVERNTIVEAFYPGIFRKRASCADVGILSD